MNKAKPRTGEKRKTNQPFHIDRLPPAALEAILALRNGLGKTFEEISALSTAKKGEGGFIEWDKLDPEVRKLFPKKQLPLSSLHRWYDVRIDQVQADVMRRSEQALKIAEAFAKSMMVDGDVAVVNAARDTIMSMIAEDGSAVGRKGAARALIALAEVMQQARANDIKERKVSTEERKVKLLEEREAIARRKLEAEAAKLERKRSKGELKREDVERLVETVFGLPAKAA